MSKAAYIADLRRRLDRLETRMRADKKALDTGTPRAKVKAAGDLAVVEERLDKVKAKLSQVEAEPESAWEGFKAEVEEDLDHLEVSFDRWVQEQE